MNTSLSHSKKMHDHTEKAGSFFTNNSINEIVTRYSFCISFAKNKKVLEIGPGTGFASKKIVECSNSYLAIEYSSENLELFKLNYPNDIVLEGDFTKKSKTISQNHGRFNCIISMANIYYFNIHNYLESCNNVIQKNGYLIFCTSNKLNNDFTKGEFTQEYYNLEELKSLLNKYGYETEFFGAFKINDHERKLIIKYMKILIRNILTKNLIVQIKKFFGFLKELPKEIDHSKITPSKLFKINCNNESVPFKIIYCSAKKI